MDLTRKLRFALCCFLVLSGALLFVFLQERQHPPPAADKTEREGIHLARKQDASQTNFFQPSHPTRFPYPEGLRPQVEFWKKIFTEYTSRQAVIHDRRHVNIIYTVLDLTKRQIYSERARKKAIQSAVSKYKRILTRLDRLDPPDSSKLSEEEQKVFRMISEAPGNYRYSRARRNFRIQYGLRDSFQKALSQSTRYLKEMERIFADNGLPVELTRLPFIESSFNVDAHSLSGATGIWQFTPSTGKHYVRIDQYIDERRNPLKATAAAAQLLSFYYDQLDSWPLAITAYNHGSYAMQQAVRLTKSRDLETIINTYKGNTFGFSSRNFYVEFLAVLEILEDYRQYFGEIEFLTPEPYEEFILEHYIKMDTLVKYSSFLTRDGIARLNPELRKSVLTSRRFLPRDYPLKIPMGMKEKLEKEYAMIASMEKHSHIQTTKLHRVKSGQSLSSIARLYRTSVTAIIHANSLEDPDRLSEGQVLKIPTQA